MEEELRARYRGDDGEFLERLWMERDVNCLCCGEQQVIAVPLHPTMTVRSLVERVVVREECCRRLSLWLGLTPLFATVLLNSQPHV